MFRLTENFCQDENSSIELYEIQHRNSEFSTHEISRIIIKIPMFKNCVVQTKRCKHNYKKFTKVYNGLAWKSPVSKNEKFEFQQISSMVQENIILIHKTEHEITLGHFNGCLINGNRMLTEVTFHASGIWNIIISEKKIVLMI